jgi:hypothetical protein
MKLFAAPALALVAATPAFANTPYSRGVCLLSYGSEVQLNGPCEYTLDKDGSLYVSDVPASKGNLFAYVNLNGDGTADASWNGGGGSHAQGRVSEMGDQLASGTIALCRSRPGVASLRLLSHALRLFCGCPRKITQC